MRVILIVVAFLAVVAGVSWPLGTGTANDGLRFVALLFLGGVIVLYLATGSRKSRKRFGGGVGSDDDSDGG